MNNLDHAYLPVFSYVEKLLAWKDNNVKNDQSLSLTSGFLHPLILVASDRIPEKQELYI